MKWVLLKRPHIIQMVITSVTDDGIMEALAHLLGCRTMD